jgi:hypothetical protein
MITNEHLTEKKAKYQERADYYKKLGFDVLEVEFNGIVQLIEEMEEYLKENDNGKA